ncbi:MAG TPA: hypothetical protein VM841_07635 [Actinomycetota bacterium]|nr:hypothetical protein [Actinomycetota bacterium]
MKARLLAALVAAAFALPAPSQADPVEITETSSNRVELLACSTWIEPAGDEYEWTDVCAGDDDYDGDGVIERVAFVQQSMCDHDGSAPGGWCWTSGPSFFAELAAGDSFIAADRSSAWLHADVDGCRIDLDWTGGQSERSYDSEGAISPVLFPTPMEEGIAAGYRRSGTSAKLRSATEQGSLCPAAGVSGAAWGSVIGEVTETDRETLVTIRLG